MKNLTFFKGLESSFFFTFPSLQEREGWDKTFTSFQFHSPSLKEREGLDN